MTAVVLLALFQLPQNQSPMTDVTRAHLRLTQADLPGERYTLSLGTLRIPPGTHKSRPLLVHFHGAAWVAELAASKWRKNAATLAVQAGSGSSVYQKAIGNGERFQALLAEAESKCSCRFTPVYISSFSAGYGAIREILRDPESVNRIAGVVLADSLHASYAEGGKPGSLEGANLEPFLGFARLASAGKKRMLVAHSEVFPGTYASTTETAEYLLQQLHLQRKAVLRWGALGMQQLSSVRKRRFQVKGFAGNSAPDHADHLHALHAWLKAL